MNRLSFVHHPERPSEPDHARFVSILSGKGGVGKSVLAFNLSERIHALGYRVLLVDTDYSCANIHILANAACDYGVEQFATGQLELSEAVTSVGERFDILAAGARHPDSQLPTTKGAADLVQRLREQTAGYDFVLIDHASGINKPATVIAHGSDLNLLVLIPELTSIADAYGLFKFLVEAEESINCRLLLNRTESAQEADYIHKKFGAVSERFLGRVPGLVGHLVEHQAIRTAVASQRPLAIAEPDSPVVQTLTDISARVVGSLLHSKTDPNTRIINKTTATADTGR